MYASSARKRGQLLPAVARIFGQQRSLAVHDLVVATAGSM